MAGISDGSRVNPFLRLGPKISEFKDDRYFLTLKKRGS